MRSICRVLARLFRSHRLAALPCLPALPVQLSCVARPSLVQLHLGAPAVLILSPPVARALAMSLWRTAREAELARHAPGSDT